MFLLKVFRVLFLRGFGAISSILITYLITKNTSISDAGILLFAISLVAMLGTLLPLGSVRVIMRIVGSNFDKSWRTINTQLSAIFRYFFYFSASLIVVSYLFQTQIAQLLSFTTDLNSFIPLIVIGGVIAATQQMLANAYLGLQKSSLGSAIQSTLAPLVFLFLFYICFKMFGLQFSVLKLFSLYLISFFLVTIFAITIWLRSPLVKVYPCAVLHSDTLKSISPLILVTISNVIIEYSGQISAALYLDPPTLALFNVARRIALTVSFLLLVVNLVVAPKFAHAYENGRIDLVNKAALLGSRIMLLLAIPAILFVLIFAEFILSFFGSEYVHAATVLRVLALGQFINVITGSVSFLLNMTKHEKDLRNAVLICGPIAIALSFGLTPIFGLNGAAYATAIALSTQNLLLVWVVKKRLGFNTMNIFRRID